MEKNNNSKRKKKKIEPSERSSVLVGVVQIVVVHRLVRIWFTGKV